MPRRTRGHEDDEQRARDVAAVVERLAPNVRKLRVAAAMTQEQLAEAAGLDVSYVQRVERGAGANVTVAVLGAFARALDVDVVKLLRRAKATKRPAGRPRARPPRSA